MLLLRPAGLSARRIGEAQQRVRHFPCVLVVVALLPRSARTPVFVMKVMCYALFACAFNLLMWIPGLLSFATRVSRGAAYATGHALKEWGVPTEVGLLIGIRRRCARLVMEFLAIRRSGIYFR